MNWFLDVLKNKYAKFDGRASRPEYWFFVMFMWLVFLAFDIVINIAGFIFIPASVRADIDSHPMALFLLVSPLLLYWLAMLVPHIAVAVRRFHDQDKSGWFVLLSFIPFVGGLIVLVFMLLPGTPGDNRFGPPAPTSPGA
ncbi:MAG: DUF805 domain-containing protein [Burkholderiales bacterium]|nr:DUF805 domain-containing protein [Burkholderiales bacterium]